MKIQILILICSTLLLTTRTGFAQDADAAAERARIANQRIIADTERRRADVESARVAEEQRLAIESQSNDVSAAEANPPFD